MKILITGSEGSLMQAVIPKLLAQGHEITGVDNLYRHGTKSFSADIDYPLYQIDLADRTETLKIFNTKFDAVFLAAAKLYGVGGFHHYCADIISDDTAVQGNILKGCVHSDVNRVVYISSSMVYESGVQDINTPLIESMTELAVMPKTDYGLSKLLGERMCEAFRQQYGLNYTIWRPFNIVNPKETAMSQQGFSHVIADYIKNICVNKLKPLQILGDGEQIRCFTWLDDVAEIIANHSFSDKTNNQAINICNVEPISMKQLAEKIYQKVGMPDTLNFVTAKNYKNDVLVRVPSIEKLKSIMGNYDFKSTDHIIEQCINGVNNVNN